MAVAVVNEKGELLLQKRRNDLWGVPGGFMELGESTAEAGRREVFGVSTLNWTKIIGAVV